MPSEEQKGLSCTYVADDINENNCRAAIRVFVKDRCFIKQCTKIHDGQNLPIKLCDNDRVRYNTLEHVEIFEKIEFANNVDTNITDIYYQINAEYRKRLTTFFQNYEKMKLLLKSQKVKLLEQDKAIKRQISDSQTQLSEIEIKVDIIEIEIDEIGDPFENNTALEQLENDKQALQLQRNGLQTQITELKENLEQQKLKTQECDVNIRSMAAAAKDIFDSSTLILDQDISASSDDLPSTFSIQSDPESVVKRTAAKQKEREILQDQLLQDGLFVLMRIRCDEPITNEQLGNGNQVLEFNTEHGNSYIKIGNNELKVRGSQTMIYDDRGIDGKSQCAKDLYITNLSKKNKEKEDAIKMLYTIFNQTELAHNRRNIERLYFDLIEQHYLEYVKLSKQYIQEEEEFPGILPKTKQGAKAMLQKWEVAIDNYEPITSYNIINEKGVVQGTVSGLKDKWKAQATILKNLTMEELDSMRLTIKSGIDFITGSSIGFLERQKYSDNDFSKLLNITIIGVGGSGAGKTTAAKTLMQNIIRIYGEKYPLFVKKCTIKIAFKQIYENAEQNIIIENMNTTEVKRDLKFPYLSDPTSSNGPKDFYDICGIEEDQKCEDLTQKSNISQIKILKKIYDLDMKTEQHRRVRTTLNNSNGSSRSIKIIQIMFISSEKTVQICLVDTAGYEDYTSDESKEKLSIFYRQKLRLAKDLNPEFNIYAKGDKTARRTSIAGGMDNAVKNVENESIKKKVDEFINNVLIEGDFIRRSLKYIEFSLKKFNFLQNQIKIADQAEKAEKMKANFEEELNQAISYKDPITKKVIKVQSIPWLTPYLPQNSTVIVLGAFKTNMNSTEVSSAEETIKLLRDLRA